MSKKGRVFYDDLLAGNLSETDEGYEFIYDDKYLRDDKATAISLTLPLQQEAYTNKVLFSLV